MGFIKKMLSNRSDGDPQTLAMANNNKNYDIDCEAEYADIKEGDPFKFKQLEVKESQEIPYFVEQDIKFAKTDDPQEE